MISIISILIVVVSRFMSVDIYIQNGY